MQVQNFINKFKKYNLSIELVTGYIDKNNPFHALVVFSEADLEDLKTQKAEFVNLNEYGKVIYSKQGHDVCERSISNLLTFYCN